MGRSGTVAAAYIMHSLGVGWRKAIEPVRLRRPRAVETLSQKAVLRAFKLFLQSLSVQALDELAEFGKRYMFGRGIVHASKVTQPALILWKGLNTTLKLRQRPW